MLTIDHFFVLQSKTTQLLLSVQKCERAYSLLKANEFECDIKLRYDWHPNLCKAC